MIIQLLENTSRGGQKVLVLPTNKTEQAKVSLLADKAGTTKPECTERGNI